MVLNQISNIIILMSYSFLTHMVDELSQIFNEYTHTLHKIYTFYIRSSNFIIALWLIQIWDPILQERYTFILHKS